MTTPPPDQELEQSTRLMVFAVVSSVLMVIAIGIIIYVLGMFVTQLNRRPEPMPFNILNRPLPTVDRAAQLFPERLPPFQRTRFTGTLPNFAAEYAAGNDVIRIRGSQAVSLAAAQGQVFIVADQLGLANRAQLLEPAKLDGAYYYTVFRTEALLVYSRQRWFFEIRATSEAALAAFMSVFPY